ncbi:MAG: ShlB/FhaC/HecB family hemolysin secretion/activation protein [Myxococcota bacterium]
MGAVTLLAGLMAASASAQRLLPDQRPADQLPELPPYEASESRVGPILPPYPIPDEPGTEDLEAGARIRIEKIRIAGNTVVPSGELQKIAAPYEGRALSFSDLQTLRDRLTLAYVERGFATSGATLPEQSIEDGVVEIQIVEGRLTEIDVETDGRFRPSYFEKRIAHAQRGVLNVIELQKQLQVLQFDPLIERLQAQLEPTAIRGQSRLTLAVYQTPGYALAADFDNYRSPAIGALGGGLRGQFSNLIGVGDLYFGRFTGSAGLRQGEVRFELPINVWDTVLGVRYQYTEGDVVDSQFAALGIGSESEAVGFELRQPLYRTLQTTLGASVFADWRRAQSFLFGGEIGLPTPYSEDGRSQVSVLRFGLDASYRSRSQSLAFRTLLSWGVDILGATQTAGQVPSGRFVSWLGQIQWASRLPWQDIQLLARFDSQLSPDPLLPLEQFAIGGRFSVRGYRENTLVRDNGFSGSVELRVPVYGRSDPGMRIEIVPFVDVGRAWDNPRRINGQLLSSSAKTLASVGLGTRVAFTRWGFGELFWGHRLQSVQNPGDSNLQDDGIQFRISLQWP